MRDSDGSPLIVTWCTLTVLSQIFRNSFVTVKVTGMTGDNDNALSLLSCEWVLWTSILWNPLYLGFCSALLYLIYTSHVILSDRLLEFFQHLCSPSQIGSNKSNNPEPSKTFNCGFWYCVRIQPPKPESPPTPPRNKVSLISLACFRSCGQDHAHVLSFSWHVWSKSVTNYRDPTEFMLHVGYSWINKQNEAFPSECCVDTILPYTTWL